MSTDKFEDLVDKDDQHEPARRKILSGSALLAAAGLLWTSKDARGAPNGNGASLMLDCACLGDTFAADWDSALDMPSGDLRGASFSVEGLLYPPGTILPGDGFDPASADPIGHWLCRGWFMNSPARRAPHQITHQEYLLGIITAEEPSPRDTLSSSGVEGVPSTRIVPGGSGKYRGARGEVHQEPIGTNTTTFALNGRNAPNFRFRFALMGAGK